MYEYLYQTTKETYNKVAHDFAHTRLGKKLWEFELGEFIGIEDISTKKILDAGCGAGRVLHYFKEHNQLPAVYLGIDYSEALLKEARDWNSGGGKFMEMDLLEMKKLGEFDYITCIAVLHHFLSKYDRMKVFGNMVVNLKEGGRLFVTTWNAESKSMPKKAVKLENDVYKIPYKGLDRYYAMIRKEEIEELCHEFHCTIIDDFGSDGRHRVAGDEAMNWCYVILKQRHLPKTEIMLGNV